jgi:hypothetical protein
MGNIPSDNYISFNVKKGDEDTELLLMKSVCDKYKNKKQLEEKLEEEEIKKLEEEEIKKLEKEEFRKIFDVILKKIIYQLNTYKVSVLEVNNNYLYYGNDKERQKINIPNINRVLLNLPQYLPKDLPPYIITKSGKNDCGASYYINISLININPNLREEWMSSEIDKMKKELTQHFEEKLDYIIQHIKKTV